jgi:hypothetical protein
VAASLGACVSLNDDAPSVTVWEGTLTPDFAHPGVSGQAAAVSAPDGTSLGIGLQGAQPSPEYAWGLHLGSCGAPGQQIGPDSDYPALAVDATGYGEAETHLAPRLSLENQYYVEVRMSASDPSRLACGDLQPR